MRKFLTALSCLLVLTGQSQIKPTPANERLKVLEQRKAAVQRSVVNGTSFRNIGPSVMSGRVVDIEVNPQDPTEFYVAYATGGLWHTVNNGQSFVPVFDSADVITIGDIAVNWSPRVLWVGSGEVNSSRSTYAGLGMYKSANNGKSWEWLGLPESHHIGQILLHPKNPQVAWVAVLGHLYSANKERGVYKTSDGGSSWKQVLSVDENTGAVDLALHPTNPDMVYAAMWYRTRKAWNFEEGAPSTGIFRSANGGEAWEKISGPNSGFPQGNLGRIGLATSAAQPDVLYAVVDNNNRQPDSVLRRSTDTSRYVLRDFNNLTPAQFEALNDAKLNAYLRNPRNGIPTKYTATNLKEKVRNGSFPPSVLWDYGFDANTALFETPIYGCELYRSNDKGATWTKTNKNPIGIYSTYGYYFGKVFVSGSNADKVVLTGVDVILSTDGGKTFKSMARENVHSDHHHMWINPNKDSHMINGNDGGANITYDNGATWFKANTPAVGQFYAIAVDMAKPYNVYGGLQDNGTWFGASNTRENLDWYDSGKNPYTGIGGGDGMQVQVDWRDNKTVYSGSQFGAYSRQNLTTGDRRGIRPARDLGESALRYNWQTPILVSRHNQDVFYYGSNKFHRSFAKGDSLVTLSADLTTNPAQGDVPFGTLSTISESPLRFGLLYAGSDDGNIQVSKDGGYTWSLINVNIKGIPKGLYVSRVQASAFNVSRVYASLNGYRNDHFNAYVFVSDDFGATWRQIAKDLPAEPVNVVREDLTNEQVLYMGTDGGLYVSLDGGNTTMMWNKGLPYSVPVHDIVLHPRDNEIVLGTHGRSIYIASISEVLKKAKGN